MPNASKFLRQLYQEWVTLMSGALSVPLAFLALMSKARRQRLVLQSWHLQLFGPQHTDCGRMRDSEQLN